MTSLTNLEHHRCLAVETLRRSGAPVVTPVWFVVHEGRLYFSAAAHTGKVKRLRHTSRGRVASCDERGHLLAEWRDVAIVPAEEAQAAVADRLLAARYEWQRRLLDAFGWLRHWRYVHDVITPTI